MDIITYALSKKGIIEIDGQKYKPAAIGENGQIVYKKLPEYTTFRIGEAGTLNLLSNREQPIEELYINNVAQELPTGVIDLENEPVITNYAVNPGDVVKIKGGFSLCETELPLENVVLQSDLTNCMGMFAMCTGLTQAPVIPSSVTDCTMMFTMCTGLTEAPIIPASVTNCFGMFMMCTNLTEAPVIPSSVTNCSNMFQSCTSLTAAPIIPTSVTNCFGMFIECTSLTQAPVIPSSVVDCSSMFYECTNLSVIPEENINLMNNPPEGLVCDGCYTNCPLVADNILPSWGGKLGLYTTFTAGESGTLKVANISRGSITELYIDNVAQQLPTGRSYSQTRAYTVSNGQKIKIKGEFSLNGTRLLIKDIVLQNDLINCSNMFNFCYNLTQAPVIPSSVTNCDSMFSGCTSLTQAPVIPSSVTNCNSMFSGCTSLTQAPVIPSSVTNCNSMFSGCSNLTQAQQIPEGAYDCSNMFYGCTSLTKAPQIPEGVGMCNSMFSGCTSLTQAPVIPNSIINCTYMFNNCTSLTQAPIIPSSVTNCDSMFIGCTSLTQAPVIPNSVTNCMCMFNNCTSLTQAPIIPSSVTNCDSMLKGCSNLTTLPEENINLMYNPPEGLSYTDCYKNCPLVADIVLVSWGGNKEIPGLYTTFTVGESGTLNLANMSSGSITELYIDNVAQELPTGTNFTKISKYTVENGQKIKIKGSFSLNSTTLLIKDIVLQNDLEDCSNMFCYCTSLTEAPAIPSSVTNCSDMFNYCTSLTQAPVIPNSVTNCSNMFYNCTSLTQAPVIPSSVRDCSWMFSHCNSLTTVPEIQEGVTNCNHMFFGCARLTAAPVIPSSVTNCSSMFSDSGLTQAPIIPSSVVDCSDMFNMCFSLTTLPEENVNLMNNPPEGLSHSLCYANCQSIVNPIKYDQIPIGWK